MLDEQAADTDDNWSERDSCIGCGDVHEAGGPCDRRHALAVHLLEYLEADSIVDALAAITCSSEWCLDHHGWAIEAPMRDRARSLDHVWREDTRRQYLGIPSVWS